MNDLEIRRIIYGFLQAGLVEIIRPAGATPLPIRSVLSFPTEDKEEQKSLVNRLITQDPFAYRSGF